MRIKICDMPMGAGKTSAAISQMKQDTGSQYIFVTPYLDEVERVKSCCAERGFRDPINYGRGKLAGLHSLLASRRNIASTHALFKQYNEETMRLIQEGKYKLILDEVAEVVSPLQISKDDMSVLIDAGLVSIDSAGYLHWDKDSYDGVFNKTKEIISTGRVAFTDGKLMGWEFPIGIFEAFQDVVILTYMFDAQKQKYYFDMNGVETEKIGTICEDGIYHFSDTPSIPLYMRQVPSLIHILDDDRMNEVGNQWTGLSSTWFTREKHRIGMPELKHLRNNLINLFINKYGSPSAQNMWTTFEKAREVLKSNGYAKGFLPCNARATNKYRDRDHLAYCVNVFFQPAEKSYFEERGIHVLENKYALSEMVQWIWRSAIRDGKPIWIYIPSHRMRTLLQQWLDDLSKG